MYASKEFYPFVIGEDTQVLEKIIACPLQSAIEGWMFLESSGLVKPVSSIYPPRSKWTMPIRYGIGVGVCLSVELFHQFYKHTDLRPYTELYPQGKTLEGGSAHVAEILKALIEDTTTNGEEVFDINVAQAVNAISWRAMTNEQPRQNVEKVFFAGIIFGHFVIANAYREWEIDQLNIQLEGFDKPDPPVLEN